MYVRTFRTTSAISNWDYIIRLLQESSLNNSPILCCDNFMKEELIEAAKRMRIYIPEPLSVFNLVDKQRAIVGTEVIVDDASKMLKTLLHYNEFNVDPVVLNIIL